MIVRTKIVQMNCTWRKSVQRIDKAKITAKYVKTLKKSKNTPILAIFVP